MSLHSKIVSIIRDEQFQINSKIISRWITNYYLPIRMIFTCSMSISWSILILLFTNIRHRLSNPLWEIHMFVNPDIILYFSNTTLIFQYLETSSEVFVGRHCISMKRDPRKQLTCFCRLWMDRSIGGSLTSKLANTVCLKIVCKESFLCLF